MNSRFPPNYPPMRLYERYIVPAHPSFIRIEEVMRKYEVEEGQVQAGSASSSADVIDFQNSSGNGETQISGVTESEYESLGAILVAKVGSGIRGLTSNLFRFGNLKFANSITTLNLADLDYHQYQIQNAEKSRVY